MGTAGSAPVYYPGAYYPPGLEAAFAPPPPAPQPNAVANTYLPYSKLRPNQPIGSGETVVDLYNKTIWVPDQVAATTLDAEDGVYDRKYHGLKIKVMKQKKGQTILPGHPASYGMPEYEDRKDPYIAAGVAPGQCVYDPQSNTLLVPDAVMATQLDLEDGVVDGTYRGAKLKVKKSKNPAYNPQLARKKKMEYEPFAGYGGYGASPAYGGAYSPYGGYAGYGGYGGYGAAYNAGYSSMARGPAYSTPAAAPTYLNPGFSFPPASSVVHGAVPAPAYGFAPTYSNPGYGYGGLPAAF